MQQIKFFRYVIVLIILNLSTAALAQETIEKPIGSFKNLKVFDFIEASLIPSTENKVVISGSNPEDVNIVQSGNTLKVRMILKKSFKGSNIEVKIYYTAIELIDANEGCIITANNTIKTDRLELRTQEGATIDANIEVNYLKSRAVTGGIIDLGGTSKNHDISIYTGGILNGEDFQTVTTTVSINAAGEASVMATEKVDAKIRAGGTVYVYGNPKSILENIALGGNLKRM